MNRYDATEDPLCYIGTSILINKAGLRSQDELDQFEQLMFLTRSEEPLPDGALDYAHYKRIHHHFFQDVYDWRCCIDQLELETRPTRDGFQAMRSKQGRPSPVIRFSTRTPILASVF